VLVALDATIAELATEASAATLESRLRELRELRDPIDQAAQAALAGPLEDTDRETVEFALGQIEAALRARAAGA
jgi:hypothetical protein